MRDITDRFLEFCEHLILQGVVKNTADFAKEVGISTSMMTELAKGRSNVGTKAIHNSVIKYHLNTDWLYTGQGKMFKGDTYNSVSDQVTETKHLIPFYDDAQSIGGNNTLVANMEGVTIPSEYIDAGDWFKQATSAIRHYGDSMVEYPSGCILALKEVENFELVVWGRNYVVETDEYRITKRIQKGKTEKYIVAYSSNDDTYPDGRLIHEPIDIPKKMIRSLSLVLGYVVKQSSSGKVYINGKRNEKMI